jgi:hypothetical protein
LARDVDDDLGHYRADRDALDHTGKLVAGRELDGRTSLIL